MKNLLSVMALLAMITVLCASLSACAGEEHKHTYGSSWQSDSNYHWLPATCEHTDMKKYEEPHGDSNSDGVCDTCGYVIKVVGGDNTDQTPDDNIPDVECSHIFSTACDADCNLCGEVRVPANHVYDNACDAFCNVCSAERTVGPHVYDNACDASCNSCGAKRDTDMHVYTNACDDSCNVCGATRSTADHVYDHACDTDCNVCGQTRTVGAHGYTNACDPDCNICGATRVPDGHVYTNACDDSCNVCGATRTASNHAYTNACDTDCNVCGQTRVPSAHVFSNGCDTDCNVCGKTREVAGHNFESWTVIKQPTTTAEGLEKSSCTECGFETQVVIPKLEPDVCNHKYDNACDTTCNLCGEKRTTSGHTYTNACDSTCNACGATRTPASHVYNNACDADCNVCAATRVPAAHVYTSDCDSTCNVCQAVRSVGSHSYDNDCDTTCNLCGEVRNVGSHVYDNACDASCNECGATRPPASHVYSNDCDTTCNVCKAVRSVGNHVYDNACDTSCNECGATRTPASHVYSNACDTTCNVCQAVRSVGGHKYNNACDADCNICGAIRTVSGHSFGAWVTVKEPTTTTEGLKKASCTECGFEKEATIPKLDNTGSLPGGGDNGDDKPGIPDEWDENTPSGGNTGSGDNTGDDNTGSGGNTGSGAYAPALPSVDSATQTKLDKLDNDRDSYHSNAISSISSYLGGSDAAAALKQIYTLFDSDYYLLLSHLFDPGVGGFYYSISARDNDGFLPDLESSRQILNVVNNSGLASAYGNNWINLFSSDEKALIAKFVQDMKADDGYYYHPQWGTNISTSRRSRDLTSATFILKSLGLIESAVAIDDYASSPTGLTSRLGTTASYAVARVVATSATPSHLASEAAFRAYMEEREAALKSNSYSIGNTLSAQSGEINAAGLHSVLIEYLNKWQFDNGLWESTVSYNAINGLMKISMMYTTDDLKNNITKTKAALNSLMTFMLDELDENGNLTDEALEAVEGITFIYNPWVSLAKLSGALTDTDKTNFNTKLKANAANLINGTYKKLCVFEKKDGGFSYQPKTSSYQSQGEIVALRGVAESDVNATTIAAGMVVSYILPVFGVPTASMPKLFTEADSEMFYELLNARTPVEKVVVIGTPVKVTYDNYEESEGDTEGGVLLYPDYSVITNVGDRDTENGKYIWFQSGIVQNPAAGKTDNVLYAESFIRDTNGDGEYKSTSDSKEMAPSGYSSSTDFSIVNYAAEGNTYVFETDIYVSPTKTGTVAELYFQNKNNSDQSTKLQLNAYTSGSTTYLRIVEANYFYGSNGNNGTIADKIAVNAWVKLRFELTKTYDASGKVSSMLMSIYVNDTLAKTFESGKYDSDNACYYDFTINAFRFSYFRSANTKFYFNNSFATKITK